MSRLIYGILNFSDPLICINIIFAFIQAIVFEPQSRLNNIMKKHLYLIVVLLLCAATIYSQKGSITGRLIDHQTLEPVVGIPVIRYGTTYGNTTDENGQFLLEKIRPQPTEIIIAGNTLSGDGEEYYHIAIRNIPLDRQHLNIDLGDIKMINKSVANPGTHLLEVFGFKFPYAFQNGSDRMIEGMYILVDFNNYLREERNFKREKQDTTENFFSHRYPGGAYELRKNLAVNLLYPAPAVENGIVGMSLASCTLNPDGSINGISIVNPVCPSIDQAVKDALSSTDGQWTSIDKDTLEALNVQIVFVLSGIPFYTNTLTAYNMLESIDVTAMGVTYAGQEDLSDDNIALSINESLKAKDYEAALKGLDEAIRRNPFKPDLYQVRIMVNTKLGDKDRVMEDVIKIGNFLNGKSLQQVLAGE